MAISPASVDLTAGAAQQFSATVSGAADPHVIWSIAEGSAGGTVTGAGLRAAAGGTTEAVSVYTAPAAAGTYHIVAASHADPSATASAAVTVTPAGPNLVDHGGPVLATPHVYAIWWGDQSVLSPSVQPFQDFVAALDGSSYLAIADQYLRGQAARVSFARNLFDPAIPAQISAGDIGAAACAAIAAAGLAVDPLGIYVVFTSVVPNSSTGAGWHSYGACSGAPFKFAWVGPSPEFNVNPCGTLPGPTAIAIANAGHELLEIMTDGGPGDAWIDRGWEEIADKCQYGCHSIGSQRWLTNALWSNASGTCEPQ